jgi:hypothetical protein
VREERASPLPTSCFRRQSASFVNGRATESGGAGWKLLPRGRGRNPRLQARVASQAPFIPSPRPYPTLPPRPPFAAGKFGQSNLGRAGRTRHWFSMRRISVKPISNAFAHGQDTRKSIPRPMPCMPRADADRALRRSARHRAGQGLASSARPQAYFAQSVALYQA